MLKKFKGCHNPYFNRWFSAIKMFNNFRILRLSHNPYFNRWFSAIKCSLNDIDTIKMSQSLF